MMTNDLRELIIQAVAQALEENVSLAEVIVEVESSYSDLGANGQRIDEKKELNPR